MGCVGMSMCMCVKGTAVPHSGSEELERDKGWSTCLEYAR